MEMNVIIIGMAFYFLMKLFAYTAFAKFLNIYFQQKNNIWKIGFIRTIIGIVLGAIHNGILMSFISGTGRGGLPASEPVLFFSLLVVLRIFEWWLIIRLFYKSKEQPTKKKIIAISFGIICSFIIDIPVFLGLISVVSSIC